MLVVYKYGYPAGTDTPDVSGFVVKLETWLRMSGIPYETRTGTRRDMPKGKLPTARIDGRLIADSSFIIAHLQQHDPRALRDSHLGPLQAAQAEAIKALVENHLYFVSVYQRWCLDEGFRRYCPLLIDYGMRSVPAWQRPLLPVLAPLLLRHARRNMVAQTRQQGIGRHGPDEVVEIGKRGVHALATLLGQQDYLFGAAPSTVDASVFGFLHTLLKHPFPGPLQDFALAQPALVAYHDRIWERYWSACFREKSLASGLRPQMQKGSHGNEEDRGTGGQPAQGIVHPQAGEEPDAAGAADAGARDRGDRQAGAVQPGR